jgi:hypothetical protein
LEDLSAVDRLAVDLLRIWCAGGPVALSDALSGAFGAADATTCAFHDLCQTYAQNRAGLTRHHPGCPCLSADEARFAALLGLATCPDTDEALIAAFDMVDAPAAPILTARARQAALSLRRLTLQQAVARKVLH